MGGYIMSSTMFRLLNIVDDNNRNFKMGGYIMSSTMFRLLNIVLDIIYLIGRY
jgi:hypothetical protein